MSIIQDFKNNAMGHGHFFLAQNNIQNRNESITVPGIEESNMHPNDSNQNLVEQESSTLSAPLYDIVPLYGCEKLKSQVVAAAHSRGRLQGTQGPEVRRRKFDLIRLQGTNSQSSYSSTKSGTIVGANGGTNFVKGDGKSYMDLHYAKIGYPYVKGGRTVKNKDDTDTVLGVCGTQTNRSSESLHIASEDGELFEDAQSCLSDNTSFYEKIIEKELMLNTFDDELSDFKSVSQISSQKVPFVRNNKNKIKSVISIPVLGSLGPDILSAKAKMENLKKQQKYGQKASEQNRIKMMEKKILLGLRSEMKKSVYVENEYLNKYIHK